MAIDRRTFGVAVLLMAVAIAAMAFGLPARYASLVRAGLVMGALGISFQIVFGLLGQLSLGHSALFGVGAYTYAFLALHGVPIPVAAGAACLAGGLTGMIVAAMTARLGGAYFAVVTYATTSVVAVVVSASAALGQTEGLIGVPAFGYLRFLPRSTEQLLYAGMCFLLTLAGFYRLWRSRLGATLEAIRADPVLAGSLGINVPLATVVATGISGVFAGLIGAVYVQSARFVSPDVFSLYFIITPLAAVTIGGTRAVFGALVGSIVVVVVPLALSIGPIANQVVSGLLLTFFVIVFPLGLSGAAEALGRRRLSTSGPEDAIDAAAIEAREWPGTAPGATVLDASGIGVSYGGVHAVRDFAMELRAGEIVGLIGPNGAGKSSLVGALSGTVRSSGRLILAGADLSGLPAFKRTRLGLARTFQNTALVDALTVAETVGLAQGRGRYRAALSDEGEALIRTVIAACGLGALRDRPVGELTYMDRRLTAIAATLVTRPAVVFLDEATAGLAAEERARIAGLVTQVARAWGTTFLVIEHDVEFVATLCDRLLVMNDGRFLKSGTPDVVLNDPEVVESYLGSAWNAAEDRPA